MPNFSVKDRTSPRFESDFQIDTDPARGSSDDEKAYLVNVQRTLDKLASDAVGDGAARLRPSLLAARTDWRKRTATRVRAEADNLSAGAIDAKLASEQNAAIESDYAKNIPDIDIVAAKPELFPEQFIPVDTAFNADAAEQAYLDQLKGLLELFAKEESEDTNAHYSQAALEARRRQRTDACRELKKDFAFWKEGTDSQTVSSNISFIVGSYRALRDRLGRPLFAVGVVSGTGNDAGHNIDLKITLESDLPPPDDKPSPDKQDLFVQISNTKTVIEVVCRQIRARAAHKFFVKTGEEQRGLSLLGEYVDKLAGIGRLGLEGPHTDLAKLALTSLKAEFVAREAEEIMNRYVRRLGIWAASFAFAFLLAYVLIRNFACTGTPCTSWWEVHKSFLLAGAGASIGTWASFSVRQINLAFEQLAAPEEDLLDAPLRIVFVAAMTLTACLLFWTGAINIEVGNLKTGPDSFKTMGSIAILIGMFCGLSERALATAVSGRANAFVRGIAGGG